MKKENGDEKLISFLRAHKPDVPRESLNFEQKTLGFNGAAPLAHAICSVVSSKTYLRMGYSLHRDYFGHLFSSITARRNASRNTWGECDPHANGGVCAYRIS
ncbi:MAG: hypothetical protein FJY29_04715 [Betaproteobacteria bacterium]|nr:hypothetical protein [Betaproteobacteria bacterium]